MVSPKQLLPLLALGGIVFAVNFVVQGRKQEPVPPPVIPPPKNPFGRTIAGAGIVEPRGELAAEIGPPVPGVVSDVLVTVGAVVTRGTVLFRLDDRALRAERRAKAAALDVAKARLARLEALPRAEELPPLEARVEETRATLADLESQLARLEKAFKSGQGVISIDEVDRRRFQVLAARKGLARAEAELALMRAGAFGPDVAQARAEVAQAEAALGQTETEIDRYAVKAPTDGTVLELAIAAGDYASTSKSLVRFGDTSELHVRVDVDEESAPLVRRGLRAVAIPKGIPDAHLALEFVRIEPYVRPKRSLTGDNTERVDTRVLQVIFKLGRSSSPDVPLYVGQQVDVFMEAPPESGSGAEQEKLNR